MTNEMRKKILSMFILGYDQETPPVRFLELVQEGLGGVIFFTRNIITKEQFKTAVKTLKARETRENPLFLSIDQEGGRVERTLNIHNGSRYLSARDSAKKGEEFVKAQTKAIALELKEFGLNMNFSPVLDVDTNPENPVIAERSFSSDPDEVSKFGTISAKTYLENGIIPVSKHFPGHGDTAVDSHKAMPVVDLSLEELEKIHIKPFRSLIQEGAAPVIMAAHVHYTAFEKEPLPASVSKKIITGFLRNTLDFKGLVISDDMVMGGIKGVSDCSGFSSYEAVKKGIEAGINMFIFRNADNEVLGLIEKLCHEAEKGNLDLQKIEESLQKIRSLKSQRLTNV